MTRDSLRALRWIAPGADTVRALTELPVACAAKEQAAGPARAAHDQQRELGRIAFESPALLGGAAARMGLSCASCHLNGRGNPDFFVEGVSGAPGTADVTSNLFSKVRGNGAADPVAIPDLAARDGKQIRDRKGQAFRDKVRGLIVEEFDGLEPPPAVFEAVLVYLDSLDVAHCSNPAATAKVDHLGDYGAVLSASAFLLSADAPADVKLFYIRAARERLERLHERYAGRSQAGTAIETLNNGFAEAATAIREGRQPRDLTDGVVSLVGPLFRDAARSLYNPDVLREALAKAE